MMPAVGRRCTPRSPSWKASIKFAYAASVIFDRTRLEMLNLSHNRLGNVEGLASLAALIALNLGE